MMDNSERYTPQRLMMQPLRVLLADDEPTLCSALRLLLDQEPRLLVVGEAAESGNTLQQVATLQPDVLLLDWELPGAPTAALVRALHTAVPGVRIIAMSSRPEAQRAALAAGAAAFVSKGDPPDCLLETIWRLHAPR